MINAMEKNKTKYGDKGYSKGEYKYSFRLDNQRNSL